LRQGSPSHEGEPASGEFVGVLSDEKEKLKTKCLWKQHNRHCIAIARRKDTTNGRKKKREINVGDLT